MTEIRKVVNYLVDCKEIGKAKLVDDLSYYDESFFTKEEAKNLKYFLDNIVTKYIERISEFFKNDYKEEYDTMNFIYQYKNYMVNCEIETDFIYNGRNEREIIDIIYIKIYDSYKRKGIDDTLYTFILDKLDF